MSPEQILLLIYGGFATVMGAVLGSFLNVCILRWPHDRSLLPPSACPSCDTRLGVFDLIPILSWIGLRGRCRHCGAKISPVYPLIEALTAMLAWLLFRRFVNDASDLTLEIGVTWSVYFFFFCCLIIMAFVDLKHHIIPDQTSSYALPVGLLGVGALHWLNVSAWPVPTIQEALLGMVLGGGFLAVIALVLAFALKREALGWGDVKALAMIGCFMGAVGVWQILFIASTLSAIFGLLHLALVRQRDYLPFAPSLALTCVAHVLYGDHYLRLIFPGLNY